MHPAVIMELSLLVRQPVPVLEVGGHMITDHTSHSHTSALLCEDNTVL